MVKLIPLGRIEASTRSATGSIARRFADSTGGDDVLVLFPGTLRARPEAVPTLDVLVRAVAA
jgi:hypothetical protein